MAGRWHLDPETYLAMVRSEIPSYDELQERLADATADVHTDAILDLGSGTGVTAVRVLARHPCASLIGVDSSPEMLEHAKRSAPSAVFLQGRLEASLPPGPFDLVVSAFAIHHLASAAMADLFKRIARARADGLYFATSWLGPSSWRIPFPSRKASTCRTPRPIKFGGSPKPAFTHPSFLQKPISRSLEVTADAHQSVARLPGHRLGRAGRRVRHPGVAANR
jgi:SAM-dependent methyltransferase